MRIENKKLEDKYYQALIARDASFLGSFYVGVKTTSIFCIATCRARKPKRENVEFFDSLKSAMDNGYRPCKVCRPTENAHQAPEEINRAIDEVRANPKQKVGDARLRQMGIAPEKIRRWFNKHYGMTFQAFQRMYRINNAMIELKQGKSATDSAFDSGYDSLSGFGYTFKKYTGKSPSELQSAPLLIDRFTTPLGPMFACASDQGLCLLEFVDRRMLETEFEDLQRRLKTCIMAGENEFIRQAKQQVAEYFAGERLEFDIPLHTPGTEFQNRVWQALKQIDYGDTASYMQQAVKLGNPKAVRAVASANGMNRLAIIIPCHRVIGKDGKLVGYAGGLERKRWLLEHEAKIANKYLALKA
ncbi:methylated-DNA--[protein]-cysteine S-methyltransferase [Shewanella submarina]|uniref:Methylated-DNA--protein-cysteine methyltransferase n=1 Tax=Shewanella submarina TaxID=2016376 RepID=A0ABV7GHX6_9GAMM|nr:methylated-DNA--[protein]-cysteine S-methyltransferase [Shewanella submarina]MCL1035743.1 methylated-DNA--[protein]-cysteine S-methyltransferase [Shewanella submarina]